MEVHLLGFPLEKPCGECTCDLGETYGRRSHLVPSFASSGWSVENGGK